jgi:hypothetical protein
LIASGLVSAGPLSAPTWATRFLEVDRPRAPVGCTSRASLASTTPITKTPAATTASVAIGRVKAPGPAEKRRGVRPRSARKRKIAAIRNTWTAITSSAAIVIATQYAVRMSSAFGECPARGPKIVASAGAANTASASATSSGTSTNPAAPAFGFAERPVASGSLEDEEAALVNWGAKARAFYGRHGPPGTKPLLTGI